MRATKPPERSGSHVARFRSQSDGSRRGGNSGDLPLHRASLTGPRGPGVRPTVGVSLGAGAGDS